MKQLFGTIIFVLLTLPSSLFASGLSASEKAAKTERAPTSSERRLNKKECSWTNERGSGKVVAAPGVSGRVLELSDVQIVKSLELRRTSKSEDGFSLQALPLLPNGGIAGKDFCGLVRFFTFERAERIGSVVQGFGVLLRSGLDVSKDYPNTSTAIRSGNYLVSSRAGAYAIFDLSRPKVKSWWESQGATWSARRNGAVAFSVENRLFYPINVK